MAPKIKLTYFDIEGAAECVRLTCLLAGLDYEDVRVKFPDWQELKPKTPHGTLPIMQIDDGPMRVQSQAMVRYLASEFSDTLYPKDKLFDIEEAIGLAGDFSRAWTPNLYMSMRPTSFGYPEGYGKTDEGKAKIQAMREAFCKDEMPKWLNYLTAMLDKNDGKWLASTDAPTIADCILVPTLRGFTRGHIDHVPTTVLDSHPKIVDYIKRFCALPQIKGRYTTGLHE